MASHTIKRVLEDVRAAQVFGATRKEPAEREAGVMVWFAVEGMVKLEGPR